MGRPTAISPFAAMTRQQQKEQWICWQSQKQSKVTDIKQEPTDADLGSESVLEASKPTESRASEFKIHHGQYDAILARMKQAQKQARSYIDC